MSNVQLGYTHVIDPISFKSIPSGKIYIGEYGTLPNPANAGTWKQAYFVQDDGSRVAASQPVRTNAAGFAVDSSGNIKTVQVDGQYSILIQDSFGVQKYSNTRVNEFSTSQLLSVDAITAVNATGLPDGIAIIAKGRSTVGDGGGGVFRYSAGSVQTADGGVIFSPASGSGRLLRDGWTVFGFNGPVYAAWWGTVANTDGTTGNGNDDTAALQAAINFAFPNNSRPNQLILQDGWYRTTSTLTIPNAHWALTAESHRAIIWCDHNSVGMQATNAGNYAMRDIDLRRVTGQTGQGLSLLSSPEGLLENVFLTNHTDNLAMQDSHLTTLIKCRISGATGKGINDLGRCFASGLFECNVIGNAYGADLKSDWKIVGGAIEQNTVSDMLISTTADYEGKYWGWVSINGGCHMEGLSGGAITTDQIVVGPSGASVAGPSAKIGLIIAGSFILGNSATRTAINFRQGDLCSVTENYFKDYLAGATLIKVGAACTGGLFQGNRWDGTGTFKSINASANNILDFETENSAHAAHVMSITHSITNGGRIRGANTISSAARNMSMFIDSMRNTAATDSLSLRTVGADLATLFSRIAISGGADVGKVTFPSATVEVSGSYTSPFKIGSAYFWINAGKLYLKDGSLPLSATDGTIVGTQT